MNKRRKNNVYLLALTALMIAIQFIFGFTPIGTIQTPVLTITLMGIPVAIIACVFGPIMGLVSGTVWGIISLIQAFTGMDATAIILQECVRNGEISNARYFSGLIIMALISRMLVGFLTGLIHDAIAIVDRKGYFAPYIASMCTALLNTILFMTSFCAFFYNTPVISHIVGDKTYSNVFLFVFAIIGINFVVEFITNGIIGGSCALGINKATAKNGIYSPLPHFFTGREKKAEEK